MTATHEHARRLPLTFSGFLRLPLIDRWLDLLRPRSVLEAGCGVGGMGLHFAERYEYRGYEPDLQSYSTARQRLGTRPGAEVVNSAVPTDPDRLFELVCAFEVLEHIEDDVEALRTWARWLAPGGHMILSVPAHPHRFGPCDRAVGHCRRYSRETLTDTIESAGLRVLTIEAWGMPMGYLLEGIRNLLARFHRGTEVGTEGSGRLLQPRRMAPLFDVFMKPASVMQRPFRDTDWGTGFIAVARPAGFPVEI